MTAQRSGFRSISMPVWILTGAALGIVAGIGFGERTLAIVPVGTAYTMLLEIAIYPYILSSLLQSIGRLAPDRAAQLLSASWPAYAFLWAVVLAVIALLTTAIPAAPPPLVLQPQPPSAGQSLLALLIPANPFGALDQNDVPAIVIFGLIYGIALQGIAQRQTLFDVLECIRLASLAIWKWVVLITPVGVFALLAGTAGTLRASQIGGFLLYTALFLAGTLLLTFLVLPLALTAVAPIRWRDLLRELRPGFVLAFTTTLPVVSLPVIQRVATRVARQAGCPDGEETDNVIQASVSLAYVLAQAGNYFCMLLIAYAAYRAHHALTMVQTMLLPLLTILSCVGTPSTVIGAVSFFASWLHLPPETTALWIETSAITRYGQVLLSVSSFAFIASVVPLVYWHNCRVVRIRALLALGGGFTTLSAVVLLAIMARPMLFVHATVDPVLTRSITPDLASGVSVTVLPPETPAPASSDPPTVASIQRAGVLRVGFNDQVAPFSYRNANGALVGYDISFAYQLARDLSVRLELIPFAWDGLANDLVQDRFDIAMSGIYITDTRLANLIPGPVMLTSPIALLVPSSQATRFTNRVELLARPSLRLAVPESPLMSTLAHRLFPNATLTVLSNYAALPSSARTVDAALWTLYQARDWVQMHSGWTAVVPTGTGAPILIASVLPPNAESFRTWLGEWFEIQKQNGFADEARDYWLRSKIQKPKKPRWNVLDAWKGML